MRIGLKISITAVAMLAAACTNRAGDNADIIGQQRSNNIIGTDDFVIVLNDGANIPAKYRPLIDAIGNVKSDDGGTVTHLGGGIALTAGHVVGAGDRMTGQNAPCDLTIGWGDRRDKAPYLTSTCTAVLASENTELGDWAIIRVSPIPPVKIDIDIDTRTVAGTPLTLLSHPTLALLNFPFPEPPWPAPLAWSGTCSFKEIEPTVDEPIVGAYFFHLCDAFAGSSGGAILNDDSLRIVGIHYGSTEALSESSSERAKNVGTRLDYTSIRDYLGEIGGPCQKNNPTNSK
jgi:hypothetical protein